MSDRLHELLRQRALLQEHLAWLDAEIAAASGAPASAPVVVSTPAPKPRPMPQSVPLATPVMPIAPPVAVDPEVSAEVAAQADAMLEEYRVAPDALKTDVKKGCFLYFFAALALFALGIVGLYFFFRQGK